jgi:hypothetical protein
MRIMLKFQFKGAKLDKSKTLSDGPPNARRR